MEQAPDIAVGHQRREGRNFRLFSIAVCIFAGLVFAGLNLNLAHFRQC